MMGDDKRIQVPYFRPSIGEAEIAEVVACLRSGWLTTGPRTKQFEMIFAQQVGGKHAVAVNSATAALHLAVDALGLGPGQAVLVPTMTFAATAEVVRYQGAVPLLVDCDPVTMNMDLADAERKIEQLRTGQTPLEPGLRVVGIIPVHVGGLMMDMDRVRKFAAKHGLWVIEDAAHSYPAAYREPASPRANAVGGNGGAETILPSPFGRGAGGEGGANGPHPNPLPTGEGTYWRRCGENTSAVACFSFYANKTITTGEGGMAVTDDDALAGRMRQMSLHGLSHDAWKRFAGNNPWDYRIVAPGYKYNLTDVAAAMGIHQAARAEEMRQERQAIARRFRQRLSDVEQTRAAARSARSRPLLAPIPDSAAARSACDRPQCVHGAIARARRGVFGALASAASPSVLRRDVPLAAGASARGVAAMAEADQSAAVSRDARRRAETTLSRSCASYAPITPRM